MSDRPGGQQPAPGEDEELQLGPIEDDGESAELEDQDAEGDAYEGLDEADQDPGREDDRQVQDQVGQRRGPRGRPYGEQIRGLETRLAEESARSQRFEGELQRLLAERNAPRQPSAAEVAEQQRIERERFEMMSPYEQFQYTQQQIETRVAQRVQQSQVALWDQGDRRAYDDLLERNPAYRKFESKVEDLRRQAPGVERRVLLATAIGMQALEQGGAARTRATNRAAERAVQNGARPSQARGDVPAHRQRRGDALEERLRGQLI